MNRKEFIRTSSYLGLGSVICSSTLFTSCGLAPVAGPGIAAVAELLFELAIGFAEGKFEEAICMAFVEDEAVASNISSIFGIIKGGVIKGVNGRYSWSWEAAGKEAILSLSSNKLEDLIKASGQISSNDRLRNFDPYYLNRSNVMGIGKYPDLSYLPICENGVCYVIPQEDIPIAQLEILARRGYRLDQDNSYYNYFNQQQWYKNIPPEEYVQDMSIAISRFSSNEMSNYNYLTGRLNPQVTEIPASDSTAVVESPTIVQGGPNQPYWVSRTTSTQDFVSHNSLPNTDVPSAEARMQQLENESDYRRKNGTLKKRKIAKELKREGYKKTTIRDFKAKDIE